MDYSKGYIAEYYIALVDPSSWRDRERIEIKKGSVAETSEGLRQSADMAVSSFDRTKEHIVRAYLNAEQLGASDRVPLFTGFASAPKESVGTCVNDIPLECYSVLKPAEDVLLEHGWYAPAGMNCGEIIKQLLTVTPAPVDIEPGAPALTDYIVAEENENHRTMTDKVLKAMGWRLRITGEGRIKVGPMPKEPVAVFGDEYDIIKAPIDINDDWFDCPNVFRAVSGDMVATARDDSKDSALSTVNRGREVWMEETDCKLNENESLEEYAYRRLREEQKRVKSMAYKRGFVPGVMPTDLIRIHYPEYGITGLFQVGSFNIEMSPETNVSEEVNAWI
jgi:hypothetical protein